MAANHYATLGVAPHSPREVIRAAYLRLMRRYHPDRNPSEEAAARVRAITAAYAVLSVAEERARYDEMWRLRRLVPRPEPEAEWEWPHWNVVSALTAAGAAVLAKVSQGAPAVRTVVLTVKAAGAAISAGIQGARPRRALPPALIAAGAALLALVAYAVPAWVVPEKGIERSSVGGKAMTSASLPKPYAAAVETANDAALCSSEVASQSITRELFRRAAEMPGSNAAALERISAYSLVRFASPVVHSDAHESAAISCKARVVLHLPLGVTASGGRQSVSGIVAYYLRGGGAGEAVAPTIRAEPGFLKALASLVEASAEGSTIAEPLPTVMPPEIVPTPTIIPTPKIAPTQAVASVPVVRVPRPKPEPRMAEQTPSFSCSGQRSWAEKSVCMSANLAALDRATASLWGDAMARANASQRASLLGSDKRFVAGRDQCASESCVRSAYLANMSNIRTIMGGTPLPQ